MKKIENFKNKNDRDIAIEIIEVMESSKREKLAKIDDSKSVEAKILFSEIGILQAVKINLINYLFTLKNSIRGK